MGADPESVTWSKGAAAGDKARVEMEFKLKVIDEPGEDAQFVRSPPDRAGSCSVCLRVYPRGTGHGDGKAVSAFFELLPDVLWCQGSWRVRDVTYTLTAINWEDPQKTIVRSDTFSFDCVQSLRGWENMIPHTRHGDLKRAGWLTPAGELWLKATAEGGFGRTQPLEASLSGTKLLWATQKWTDMTVVAEDGEPIPCHRAVLASASPVFDRMLSSQLLEARERHVRVGDVSSAVLHSFVAFMYTGSLPVGSEMVPLLRLADMYEVPRLSSTCISTLLKTRSGAAIAQTLQAIRLRSAHDPVMATHYQLMLGEVKKNKSWLNAVARHLVEEGDAAILKGVAERVLSDPAMSEAVFGPLLESLP